jgi:rhodanese-related sulfurtransferase
MSGNAAVTRPAGNGVVSAARLVTAAALRSMLDDGEGLTFSASHLLHARSAPLSRLELRVPLLVPRRGTRIVLVDDGDGIAARAAAILSRYGYDNLSILQDGIGGWAVAGYELFSGVHVPSKAFGEAVEHTSHTPSIDPNELDRMMQAGDDFIIVDSRPFDEFTRVSIPTATNVPGAELVLRVCDLAPTAGTTVVVNCAGRTRSIIGAQSLINAGLPNRVVALRNGTMGWTLAGLSPAHGDETRLPPAPPSRQTLAWAKAAAASVAQRCGVRHIDMEQWRQWQEESAQRTLYLFDVRDPREYAAGHVAGAISAPGGQLVQATDLFVGTLNARIVLVDGLEVRATMTASWLTQMGYADVFVLVAAGNATDEPAPVLGDTERPEFRIEPADLAALLEHNAATVIDLSLSRNYGKRHIPGAWFAIRSRLDRALAAIGPHETVVLTSEDGVLAALAVDEARASTRKPVRYLAGGNAAWSAGGRPVTADDPRFADEPLDMWLKPYERHSDHTAAMQAYLTWEIDLPVRIARDGTTRFRPLR